MENLLLPSLPQRTPCFVLVVEQDADLIVYFFCGPLVSGIAFLFQSMKPCGAWTAAFVRVVHPLTTASMRNLILLAMLGVGSQQAIAHTGTAEHHWWTLDPWVWIPMAVFGALYLRGMLLLRAKRHPGERPIRTIQPQLVSFAGGMSASFLALIWPLDALGERSFAAHMAQHMVLIAVAAPLFALSRPTLPLLRALPGSWRKMNAGLAGLHKTMHILLRPPIAFAIHGAVIWLWHAPLLFAWALRWQWVHVIEHLTFLGSALLFWHSLQRSGRTDGQGYGAAALWMLATLIHTGLLGALITFSPRLLYPVYLNADDGQQAALEDQQLAGLLMWIPAGLCYLTGGMAYAAAWLHGAERCDRQRDSTRHPG